jgi:hypothetical protein
LNQPTVNSTELQQTNDVGCIIDQQQWGPARKRGASLHFFEARAEGDESMSRMLTMVVLAVLFGACSSVREGSTGRTKGDVLTAEEIATTTALNAYDAVSLKRPFFLKSRGMRSLREAPAGQSVEYPVVYLDRMYFGDLESLKTISVTAIDEIRYLDFNAATVQFGTGHSAGIIHIITKH